ncbi:uncharacterized protein RJT20DRAFT_952 [Scheffersomyces xylosifermentans]|uniref:uncharacterized protein n=1 Tax=Scheffersomyces xylosifermentans TaxID=1304137 RepID=UPI00315DF819
MEELDELDESDELDELEVVELVVVVSHDRLREDNSATTKIYNIIQSVALGDGSKVSKSLPLADLRERIIAKGYTIQQFDDCIYEYSSTFFNLSGRSSYLPYNNS